jgi:hypothetical protein
MHDILAPELAGDALPLQPVRIVDQGAEFYDAQHRDLQIRQLKLRAAKLGFRVVEAHAA